MVQKSDFKSKVVASIVSLKRTCNVLTLAVVVLLVWNICLTCQLAKQPKVIKEEVTEVGDTLKAASELYSFTLVEVPVLDKTAVKIK
jgi:hypothetical protein